MRRELGPDAKITDARRVLKGGFAGFFAKEYFQLTVELPNATPADGSSQAPTRISPDAQKGRGRAGLNANRALNANGAERAKPGASGSPPSQPTASRASSRLSTSGAGGVREPLPRTPLAHEATDDGELGDESPASSGLAALADEPVDVFEPAQPARPDGRAAPSMPKPAPAPKSSRAKHAAGESSRLQARRLAASSAFSDLLEVVGGTPSSSAQAALAGTTRVALGREWITVASPEEETSPEASELEEGLRGALEEDPGAGFDEDRAVGMRSALARAYGTDTLYDAGDGSPGKGDLPENGSSPEGLGCDDASPDPADEALDRAKQATEPGGTIRQAVEPDASGANESLPRVPRVVGGGRSNSGLRRRQSPPPVTTPRTVPARDRREVSGKASGPDDSGGPRIDHRSSPEEAREGRDDSGKELVAEPARSPDPGPTELATADPPVPVANAPLAEASAEASTAAPAAASGSAGRASGKSPRTKRQESGSSRSASRANGKSAAESSLAMPSNDGTDGTVAARANREIGKENAESTAREADLPADLPTLGDVFGASGVHPGVLGHMAGAPATRDDLLAALALLPKPPSLPTEPGEILAVVGDPMRASMLAAEIAAETGCSPHDVLVATTDEGILERLGTDRTVSSAAGASATREELSRRPSHNVVAVDAPLARGRRAWVRHVLEALDPSLVVGVVEASAKPEDVCAWALDLGGIDAIALEGTAFSCTPVSVIACGLPVALIDGQPATPERWLALMEGSAANVEGSGSPMLLASNRRSS